MKEIRKPLLLLLMLAFAGQGLVANALPCRMMSSTQAMSGAADMTGMNHAAHHMPAEVAGAANGSNSENCCDSGVCAMSHCQSAVTLPLDYLAASQEFAPVVSRHITAASPLGFNDTLYRPPISR